MESPPQLENGYLSIANELWDALARIRIPGEARQVLDVIIRKTYGYNKKEDRIALSQFVDGTGLSKIHVIQALAKLTMMNMVVITEKGNEIAKMYRFNKHFGEWRPLPKKVTLPKKVMTVTEKGNASLPNSVPTKYNTTKTNTTKDNIYSAQFESFWKQYPRQEGKKDAFRHFKASVKTEQDWKDIQKALLNYLESKTVRDGFIQQGSRWFNNWRDWVVNPVAVEEPGARLKALIEKRTGEIINV